MLLAGIFGLFGRVAYEQLSLVAKALFNAAWNRAGIDAPAVTLFAYPAVALGQSVFLAANPDGRVTWELVSGPGRMEPGGLYTAPSPGAGATPEPVKVRASLRDEGGATTASLETQVVLYEDFQVTGNGDTPVQYGKPSGSPYAAVTPGGVTWSADVGTIAPNGVYTAPGGGALEAVITATRMHEPKVSRSRRITLAT